MIHLDRSHSNIKVSLLSSQEKTIAQQLPQICIKYSRFITCQSNTSKGCGHDRLPNWNPQNGGMLISQPVTRCLTNHSELCMSRLLNDQSRRISIYRPVAAIFRFRVFGVFNFDNKWWPCGNCSDGQPLRSKSRKQI